MKPTDSQDLCLVYALIAAFVALIVGGIAGRKSRDPPPD